MDTDRFTKILLCIVTFMLFVNFLYGIFETSPAGAVRGNEDIGRYQISSLAAQSGTYTHHNGYYIIDTATGKVVDNKAEVHSAEH